MYFDYLFGKGLSKVYFKHERYYLRVITVNCRSIITGIIHASKQHLYVVW